MFDHQGLCGLWHGRRWNFVIWGGFTGTILAVERALGAEGGAARPFYFGWLRTGC